MINKNFSKFYIFGGLLATIILLIFLNFMGWLDKPKGMVSSVFGVAARPFGVVGSKMAGMTKVIFSLRDLVEENNQLHQANEELVIKMSGLLEAQQENKLLRAQLQVEPPLKSRLVEANLIGLDPGNLGRYIVIDRGRRDGVAQNQGVIHGGSFLVGRISETGESTSKVLVLSDPDSSIFILTEETRVSGVIKGDHGTGLVLDMVAPEKKVKEGEMIISSGLDGFLPKGLLIGAVGKKISKESDVFQKFEVKPAVNYKEIESAFVILGKE